MCARLMVVLAHENSNPWGSSQLPSEMTPLFGTQGEGEKIDKGIYVSPFLTGAISSLKTVDRVLRVLELTNLPSVR